MKKLTLTLALILSTLMSFSQTKDSDGHTLVALWKNYYKAEKADRPQDQAKALEAIKEEAASKHLAWDFYDAAQRFVSVKSSINWKDRSALTAAMEKELDEFGEPVAVFYYHHNYWGKSKSEEYVRANKEAFQKSFNPEFHLRDGGIGAQVYSAALLPLIKDDYEYALWSLYTAHRSADIRDYYGDSYPCAAFVAYYDATNYSDATAYKNLGDYIKKYQGKAVTMLARQFRLNHDFYVLRREDTSTSDQFKDLRARCETFQKDLQAFKGDEKKIADCCEQIKSVIEMLDERSIDAEGKDGKLTIGMQNIPSVQFTITDSSGKEVHRQTVKNKKNSYYLTDKEEVTLPPLDDGAYKITLKGSDVTTGIDYDSYSLSIAMRAIASGYGAYVAEYDTGRPLKSCDFQLLDADEAVLLTAENIALDGFTQLPESFGKYLGKDEYKQYFVRARAKDEKGRLCLSSAISTRTPNPGKVREYTNRQDWHAVVMTDRGAYNPDETMYFKAVFYIGIYEYELAGKDEEVQVYLYDPEGNRIGEKGLKTNEFGSIDGSFALSGASRGGMFHLMVCRDEVSLSDRYVRVDEFVLPTFDLTWDQDDKLYLEGDVVKVSGKVRAYSGHNLGSVKAHYKVEGGPEDDLELKPDGSFAFEFNTKKTKLRGYYPITLTITDDTGETLEFGTWRVIHSSLPLSAELQNKVEGLYTVGDNLPSRYRYGNNWIIRDPFARIRFNTGGYKRDNLTIKYDIKNEAGKTVASGNADSGEVKDISLSGQPSGMYKVSIVATAYTVDGHLEKSETSYSFIKAEDDDTALDMDVACFFKELGGEDIAIQVGCTNGPAWVVVELVGSGNELLEHHIVKLDGVRGKPGSLKTISYARKSSYPESLTLYVLFFKNGREYSYTRTLKLPVIQKELPLSFTRFTDLASPGDPVSMIIATDPGVEIAATVFDKATEEIAGNRWSMVSPSRRPQPMVNYYTRCGSVGRTYRMYYDDDAVYYKTANAAGGRVLESRAMVNDMAMPEAVMAEEAADAQDSAEAPLGDVHVRENFGATMAWEPCIRSDASGQAELKFTGADRLSTYYVQLFAHGEGMKNATLRREMKVSIPVKVSVVQPLFMYEGDEYVARATLSSAQEEAVNGGVSIRFFDGDDYKTAPVLATKSAHVTIPAGSSIPFSAEFDVPEGVEKLGVLVNFVADDASLGSDAVFVSVPEKKALQTLTEAHSAVLLAGQDREALIASLRAEFVNADASSLVPVERDILAMIREAIPDSIEPKSSNVISLTEAYYANVIARTVGAKGLEDKEMADIMSKIAACQNQGGGIAWFEGMQASPIVTAAVLQRIASMPGEDTGSIDVEAAVKYLDKAYFGDTGRPWWCGRISLEYYLQTRALYPSVPFDAPSGKVYRNFKKQVKAYLVPSDARGLNGQILAKARRLRTLQSLVQHPDGKTLAKGWGITLRNKIVKSLNADVESLLQYAVDHRSGGCYYPNAVMPWRGLLESELYAHSLLCDLFTSASTWVQDGKSVSYAQRARDIAEGIRLWLMIQKETQQWDKDAAYIEAIASVLRGTPETLATKVILLSTTFTKPFPEVKAAGNGFTVSREFRIDGKVVADGDPVKVGDRVTAVYRIWNEENRSFVRLTAPRPASMRPVDQLSGHYGWWMRPMSYGGWSFSPQGYRNVLADKTEYWFDSYPEENTTISEEFFVTQEGSFQMPAVEIESLYAPHYRANDDGRGPLVSQ